MYDTRNRGMIARTVPWGWSFVFYLLAFMAAIALASPDALATKGGNGGGGWRWWWKQLWERKHNDRVRHRDQQLWRESLGRQRHVCGAYRDVFHHDRRQRRVQHQGALECIL